MVEIIKKFFELSVKSYWGGIMYLVMGILIIMGYFNKRKNSNGYFFRGLFAGVGGIILGILILIMKILGKW